MCGIVAKLGTGDGRRLTDMLLHRGIRETIQHCKVGWIGHARLPIVGLSQEYDQPIQVDNWTLGFVGEILDFKDHMPEAQCDLELVWKTWRTEGPSGFLKFDGFWSILAINEENKSLHILVDYLAQKPIYFRTDVVVAASELDVVAAAAETTPDEAYLSAVIKWGYCPETWRTPYNEIRKTLPGQHLRLTHDGSVFGGVLDVLRPAPDSFDSLKTEIEEAVKRRVLSSDVPVAALVSGGLDSAITYTLAKRHGDVRAYHAENGEMEECLRVTGGRVPSVLQHSDVLIEKALTYMQEPIDLGSLLPQVALSDGIAAQGAERVCLTGDGADEMFGGYSRSMRYDSQASDVWHELVAWHLPRLDRVMMRNKIEVRSPFLARGVASRALALPWTMRRNKVLLRGLFRDDLPRGVADVPKKALRTSRVEADREAHSADLVQVFRTMAWGKR